MAIIISILLPILPFSIVGLWQKRPVAALITAVILSYLMLIIPGLVQSFQAMMIYGEGDPQLMAGGISRTLTSSALTLGVILPLLILVQSIFRRIRLARAKTLTPKDFDDA